MNKMYSTLLVLLGMGVGTVLMLTCGNGPDAQGDSGTVDCVISGTVDCAISGVTKVITNDKDPNQILFATTGVSNGSKVGVLAGPAVVTQLVHDYVEGTGQGNILFFLDDSGSCINELQVLISLFGTRELHPTWYIPSGKTLCVTTTASYKVYVTGFRPY